MTRMYLSDKTRKAPALLGVATLLFIATSCSSGTSSQEFSPSTTPSVSNTAPEIATSGVKAGDVVNGIPTKKELANNGKGDYIQTTISEDDPAMQYKASLVRTPKTFDIFTADEIADGQKFVMQFIAEEAIDSQINDNSSDAKNIDAWWAKNKDKLDPKYHEEYLSSLKSDDMTKALVFRTDFRDYSLAYGSDKTRVLKREITPGPIRAALVNGVPAVEFEATGTFTMSALIDGKVVNEDTSAKFRFVLSKNTSTDEWMISGYTNTFTTVPVG